MGMYCLDVMSSLTSADILWPQNKNRGQNTIAKLIGKLQSGIQTLANAMFGASEDVAYQSLRAA